MALLPGFALYGFAALGLIFSIWTIRQRALMFAGVIATIALGLGTNGPAGGRLGYLLLLEHLPGFEGLRTPGRLVIWTTLLLGLLAAGGLCYAVEQIRAGTDRRTGAARIAVAALAIALVSAEGLGGVAHPQVPAPPPALSTVAAPYLVLPSDEIRDLRVMLWSTDRFAPTVNGASGLVPTEVAQTRQQVAKFPDAPSIAYLRGIGVRTVVVLPSLAVGTPWQRAATVPITGLGISREITAGAIIFRLG
jgi:hypothetical protein